MREIFKVFIDKNEYTVYDLPNRKHNSLNGEPDSWWLYFSNIKLPKGITPPENSEDLIPWSYNINRRLWNISFIQRNTSKIKYDDVRFSNTTTCELRCNNKLVYSFTTQGTPECLSFAFNKAQYLQTILSEHCFNFFNPDEEQGRKILYYNLPAIISIPNDIEKWEINIKPDYTCGLTKDEWWDEYYKRSNNNDPIQYEDYIGEGKEVGYINHGDALSDGHINWFR